MKKICVVAGYAESLINFRLQLMLAMQAKGYEVVAIAPMDDRVQQQLAALQIRFIPISIERNGTNPLRDIKLFFCLKKIFRAEKPAVVFSYTIKPAIYASLAAYHAGIKRCYAMLTGTGYAFENATLKSRIVGWIAKKLLKMALRCSHKVFFQNPDNLQFFRETGLIGAHHSAVVVNGSGVDCDHFYFSSAPQQLSFLMIARLLVYKGVREYVAAAKQIKQKYPHVRCRLVGWIDSNPLSIKQNELDAWMREGDVEFLGALDDVRCVMADTSVYVLPSWNEGLPRTVLEAMAMGKPIITTDTPGCKETVVPMQNGFLIPEKNTIALYQAMEYFVRSPEKIPTMGSRSRAIAVERYDVHQVNHQILASMELG